MFYEYDVLCKSWSSVKCKKIMWLAIRNRCWTADKFTKRNLSHPEKCTLCDQEEERAQHILVECAFARVFLVQSAFPFRPFSKQACQSQVTNYLQNGGGGVSKDKKKCFNSVVILRTLILWKHRNACVFQGAQPSMINIIKEFSDRRHLWSLAVAWGLLSLGVNVIGD
jgi:hypothetical protein